MTTEQKASIRGLRLTRSAAVTGGLRMAAMNQSTMKTPCKKKVVTDENNDCSPPKIPKQKCLKGTRKGKNLNSLYETPTKRENIAADVTSPSRIVLSPSRLTNGAMSPVSQGKKLLQLRKIVESLHDSSMNRPVGRKDEIELIRDFIDDHVESSRSGSMYITGPPGTGKTACVMSCVNDLNQTLKKKLQILIINCMSFRSSKNIFKKLAEELNLNCKTQSKLPSLIKTHFCKKENLVLLVLDELDYLDSQDVLSNIFEWPTLPKSRLILIGVANALVPLDQTLPCLRLLSDYEPELVRFSPYTKEEIKEIINDRLEQFKEDTAAFFNEVVIEYIARNSAAHNGDVRKALSLLSQAILQMINTATENKKNPDLENYKSASVLQVNVQGVQKVLNTVNNSVASINAHQLPIQQKIIIMCLTFLLRSLQLKETTVGKLYDKYVALCRKQELTRVDGSEFFNLCSQLEDQGIFGLKGQKCGRMTKIFLRVDEMDLEPILKREKLLVSIMDNL